MLTLDYLLRNYAPHEGTWNDVECDILSRECMCCGTLGHYQKQLEDYLTENGLNEGVCVGDGKVWDGHHRIVGARRLGINRIPLESRADADARWLRDHGPIRWEDRKRGDRLPHETEVKQGVSQ